MFENVIVIRRYSIPDTNSCFIVLSKPFLYVVLLKTKQKKKTKTIVTVSQACYTNFAHYAPFSHARCLTTEQSQRMVVFRSLHVFCSPDEILVVVAELCYLSYIKG